MQRIVIDEPYEFVQASKLSCWQKCFTAFLPGYLKKHHGIVSWDVCGLEHLQGSIDAGHGIMLAPNHCRPCDPMLLGVLSRLVRKPMYFMASWHLFKQGWLYSWLLPKLGVFSVYREGADRDALKFAVDALAESDRMLVLFPEGVISRTNDRLNPLMDGTSFIARSAAKKRRKGGKVVIHPVAIRYQFRGNPEESFEAVLRSIEERLSWTHEPGMDLESRIRKIGYALLNLKEIELLGEPQTGSVGERLDRLVDHLLNPLEEEWLHGKGEGDVVARVKTLRSRILPDLVTGELSSEENSRRWRQLEDVYLAQQLHLYPPEYFGPTPTAEQLLETVERYEEDLTDQVTVHGPIHARIEIGEAIEVGETRDRGHGEDSVMKRIRESLERMLLSGKREGHCEDDNVVALGGVA